MTDLAIPDVEAEIRRDQYGRYLVVPPGGRRPTGYTRATTVAKTFDGEGGLIPWSMTMALTGMMRRPGLRAKFEALLAKHPFSGPWYASEASKEACKKLVTECKEAGGAEDRADIGTALHSIVEQVNRGQEPLLVQPETQADLDAYKAAVEEAGLIVDGSLCEAVVVLDKWRVAGMSDMLRVTVPGYGDVVADLKTGETLEWSWQPNCIQLAIYAHGDNVYRQGPASDGSEDQRLAMPRLSQERALIIHLPAGKATCELHWVDIGAGWEAFERSMWAREWRMCKDLHEPYTPRHPKRAPAEPLPEEGDEVPVTKVEAMRQAFDALPAERKAWATAVMVQGNNAKLSWNRLSSVRTARRYHLYRGIGALAKHTETLDGLDDWVRLIVATVLGDDTAQFPTNEPGMLLATLDAGQAMRFADIATNVANGHVLLGTDEASGVPRLIVP